MSTWAEYFKSKGIDINSEMQSNIKISEEVNKDGDSTNENTKDILSESKDSNLGDSGVTLLAQKLDDLIAISREQALTGEQVTETSTEEVIEKFMEGLNG